MTLSTVLPFSLFSPSAAALLGSWPPCPYGQRMPGPHRECLLSRPCCTPSHRGRTHCTGAAYDSDRHTACRGASGVMERKEISCKGQFMVCQNPLNMNLRQHSDTIWCCGESQQESVTACGGSAGSVSICVERNRCETIFLLR